MRTATPFRDWKAAAWPLSFILVVAGYCGYYAPYGINETDGGFLTGLAWQLVCGKTLYADVAYVRPPLPVWLRALELYGLPEHWTVLGERWIFYLKVALYAWCGAAVLTQGRRPWPLALFGFVVSVHCYPPAAWHTVDGILFSVLGIWCWAKHAGSRLGAASSGLFVVGALLCKQSFYPVALLWLGLTCMPPDRTSSQVRRAWAWGAFGVGAAGFCLYLYQNHLIRAYLAFTGGASSAGQAWQHGVLDYFHIHPALLALSVLLQAPGAWALHRGRARSAFAIWLGWLLAVAGSYAWAIHTRQDFTAPFAQSRLLFWVAFFSAIVLTCKGIWSRAQALGFGALLGVSWCASVSWGYNLPILFATPWVFALLEASTALFRRAFPGVQGGIGRLAALCLLLGVFRWGYAYVYRDGPRAAMTRHLGAVFPALHGIYSTPEKAALYTELRDLSRRYGPAVKTLPAFPQANFLTQTVPPLPLDWVVRRELGTGNVLLQGALQARSIVFLVEKSAGAKMQTDPELQPCSALLERGRVVEETRYFRVVVVSD